MEEGLLRFPEEQDLGDSINRLFAMNKEIPYLGTGGEEVSGQTLNKIFIKLLMSQLMIELTATATCSH